MHRLRSLLLLLALVALDPARAAGTGLVVAWDEREGGAAFIGLLDARAPSAFLHPPMAVPRDGWLRAARGDVFHLSRSTGVITRVDPQGWAIKDSFDLGPAAELRDIAVVSSNFAFLSSASADALLKLDLRSGEAVTAVDLKPVGGAPGVLMPETMLVDGGRLYVQLRRPLGSMASSFVAVVDLATETLIDADPGTPGIQAIELTGTEPRLKMQIVPGTRRLMLSATGASLDFGGLETVDLDALQSQGLVLREHIDVSLNDLGPFVMLDGDRGWYSGSTDIVLSSHLHPFTLSGGGHTVAADNVTFYFAPVVIHEPADKRIIWPVPDGVKFFDEDSGEQVDASPASLFSGDPSDLALVQTGGTALNAGHNGNWWGGPARNGEGVQIEVSNSNSAGQVLVATMYSYTPMGEPIFLLAVGQVASGAANVTVYIYEGPSWGGGFDPSDLVEAPWGTGRFTAGSCDSVSMTLTPNATYVARGYTELSYDLVRLTDSAIPCPL